MNKLRYKNYLALTQNYIAQTNELGSFSQNSNPGFEQHEDFLDGDNLSDIPDYDNENPPAQPTDEDSDDDVQYLGTQATNFIDKDSEGSQAHHYSSAQDEINSDSDGLEDIDKLVSQSIPSRLVSLSQNLTASQLPPSTAPVMTRTDRGVARKKTYQQDRLESQALKDKQAKLDRGARKKATVEKKLAKANQARKEDISQLDLSNRFAILNSSLPDDNNQ